MCMLKRQIIEYLSRIWDYVRHDIPLLSHKMIYIDGNLKAINFSTQIIEKKIKNIESLLFDKDTEIIIYSGKKYRIAGFELSKSMDNGNKTTLSLSCVEI